MSVAEAVGLMIAFGVFIIDLIGLVVTLIVLHNNKNNRLTLAELRLFL